jgi:hypothetical protein
VEIFPDGPSLVRWAGTLLAEQHDEWIVARKYMSRQSLARVYLPARTRLLEEEKPQDW